MSGVDGELLRELRERAGLGLRRIAGRATMSVSIGHLSRVERGERRVTPAVVAAYEQALGIRIAGARSPCPSVEELERDMFTATIGKLAAGGAPEEPIDRLVEAACAHIGPPARLGPTDVLHVTQVASLVRDLDLRFGGGLAWQLAEPALRWAIGLHDASMSEQTRVRLDVAISALAAAAGWAAFDAGRPVPARALFTVALHAAGRADDADLRAHVMADVAAHYNDLGHPEDGQTVLRLAGDERVSPAVRSILHGVRARVYAAISQPTLCTREWELSQVASSALDPEEVPRWLSGFDPSHTRAVCGHAATLLADATGRNEDRARARAWLSPAPAALVAAGRHRAAALCQLRLARVHLTTGNGRGVIAEVRQALATGAEVRSARLERELSAVRDATARRLDDESAHALTQMLADRVEQVTRPAPRSTPGPAPRPIPQPPASAS